MNKWQPIATAPKDGTEILGYHDGGREESAFLLMSYDNETYKKWWAHGMGYLEADWDLPTHWMPLPDPPGQHDEVDPE